jgi:hypothetical protein
MSELIPSLAEALVIMEVPHTDRDEAVTRMEDKFRDDSEGLEHLRAVALLVKLLPRSAVHECERVRAVLRRLLGEVGITAPEQQPAELISNGASTMTPAATQQFVGTPAGTMVEPADESHPEPDVLAELRTVFIMPDVAAEQFLILAPQAGLVTICITYNDGMVLPPIQQHVSGEMMLYLPVQDADCVATATVTVTRDDTVVASGSWPDAEYLATASANTVPPVGNNDVTAEHIGLIVTGLRMSGQTATVLLHPNVNGRVQITVELDNGTELRLDEWIVVETVVDPGDPAPAEVVENDLPITFDVEVPAGRTVREVRTNYLTDGRVAFQGKWTAPAAE